MTHTTTPADRARTCASLADQAYTAALTGQTVTALDFIARGEALDPSYLIAGMFTWAQARESITSTGALS